MIIPGITEDEIFAAILASEGVPLYDPAVHMAPSVAAKKWNVNEKTALLMLREKCEEFPIEELWVRNPKTGRKLIVFKRKETDHD